MNSYDRYYGIAAKVAGDLPDRMGRFYDSIKKDKKLAGELDRDISEWLMHVRSGSDHENELGYDLTSFVMHLIATSEKTTGLREDRMRYRDARRNRKLYLKKAAQEEMACGKPGMLKKSWEEYLKYMSSPVSDAKEYDSPESYFAEKTDQVAAWADEYSTELVDYPFLKMLSAKKQYRDYLTDISFHVFDLLTKYYGDELPAEEDGEAPIMKSPSFISEKGVFGAISSVEELQAEVATDSVSTYNNHTITTENGEISIKTIIDKIPGNYSKVSSEEDKNAIIESLSEEGKIKLSNNMLDSVDMDIFTYIFSSFNVEDVNRGRKEIKLRDIVKYLYTEAKDERKNSVIDHLNRLGTYMVEYSAYNANGDLVEVGNISFFNIIYHIGEKGKQGELTYNASLRQADGSQSSFLDEVKKHRADEITVEIMPSVNIRDAIVSSMNTVIYAEMYKKISPPKAKNMLMFLQSRRASIYPKTSLDLSVSFLAQTFRLEKYRRSVQIRHLSEMVDPLRGAGVLVKDFSVDKTNFHIDFLPFTDTELAAYHISDRSIGTTSA